MHRIYFLVVLTTAILASCLHNEHNPVERVITSQTEKKKSPDYNTLKATSANLYKNLKTDNNKQQEKQFVHFITDSLIPCWYGTKWNFYGMTETPNVGTIACGYFVTTIIRDAGIPVQRIKMAQCASEEMIKKVCRTETIKRYSNTDFSIFSNEITKAAFGLYVIGLDNHTGFIFNDEEKVWFIHSSYISPGCVLKEEVDNSVILKNSKYKVIGRLKI